MDVHPPIPGGKIGHVYITQYCLDCLFYPIVPWGTKISVFTATPIITVVSVLFARHGVHEDNIIFEVFLFLLYIIDHCFKTS